MSPALRALMLMLMLALAPAARAQEAAQSLFAAIAGDWEGSGETRGMAARLSLRWEPALDGAFLSLALNNRMTGADGAEWRFQARAFYRIGDRGAIAGHWFDSRGVSFPLTGSVDASDTMTIFWGTADTELGRSSYRVVGDQLEVTDEVLTRDGSWRVFGQHRLTRSR